MDNKDPEKKKIAASLFALEGGRAFKPNQAVLKWVYSFNYI